MNKSHSDSCKPNKSSPPQSSWSIRNPNEGETADNHRQHQVYNDIKPFRRDVKENTSESFNHAERTN